MGYHVTCNLLFSFFEKVKSTIRFNIDTILFNLSQSNRN